MPPPESRFRAFLSRLRAFLVNNRFISGARRSLFLFFAFIFARRSKSKPKAENSPDHTQDHIRFVLPVQAGGGGYALNDVHPSEVVLPSTLPTFFPAPRTSGRNPSPSRLSVQASLRPSRPSSVHSSRVSLPMVELGQQAYSLVDPSNQHHHLVRRSASRPSISSSRESVDRLSVYPSRGASPSDMMPSRGPSPPAEFPDVVLSIPSPDGSPPDHSLGGGLEPMPLPQELYDDTLLPVVPECSGRYDVKATADDEPTVFAISRCTFALVENPAPDGWIRHQHPEGAPYFYHEDKRVYTDANLYDGERLEYINNKIKTIENWHQINNIQWNSDVELVLDDGQYPICHYYFVNHRDRSVFWLDDVTSDLFPVMREVKGVTSASHFRHELESQYWYHCILYPTSLRVTLPLIREIHDIVAHALSDILTSPTSIVSWSEQELDRMLTMIDGVKGNLIAGEALLSGSVSLLSRIFQVLVRSRVYNFHGESCARLDATQSVYGIPAPSAYLIQYTSFIFFGAPRYHHEKLNKAYIDGIARKRGSTELLRQLMTEWNQVTTFATILLNANVAFLAIQSVDNNGITLVDRSPAQLSSYGSTLMSIGAVIVSQLLSRQNRNRDQATASELARYMGNRTKQMKHFELLALLYALPYAMSLWATIFFLAAFSFLCYERSGLVTRTLVTIIWAAIALITLWSILNAWDGSFQDLFGPLFAPSDEAEAGETGEPEAAAEDTRSETGSPSKGKRSPWPSPKLPRFMSRRRGTDSTDVTLTNP